ncbi:MAG: trehalose-phosphatase [Chloroflexota bacterium]
MSMSVLQVASEGLVPGLSAGQEVRLLIIGACLVAVLALDRLVIWRLFRKLMRLLGRVPLLDVLREKEIPASRGLEMVVDGAFTIAALITALWVLEADIGPVTRAARAAGLGVLEWGRTNGVRILLILVFGFLVNRTLRSVLAPLIRSAVTRGKMGVDLDEANKRSAALAQVAGNAVRIALMTVVAFMVLSELGLNIAPLLAGVSVVGIAVGFGAQNTVRDLIAGAFIIAEDQYRVGDVAAVGGKTGLVEGLTLRRTVLRDMDGTVHYIPNGEVTTASNFSKGFSRVNLDIGVGYGEDVDRVIRTINRVGAELAQDSYFGPFITEPPRALRINAFDDSSVTIKVVGVTKPIRQWEVAGEMRRRIKYAFDAAGIEIPFPQRTITWASGAHPAATPPQARQAAATDGDTGSDEPLTSVDPFAAAHHAHALEQEALAAGNLASHREEVLNLLGTRAPAGLFLDIDGTLARINPNPAAVTITPAVRQALDALSRRLHVVALTGRSVAGARGIVGLSAITYAGNHGVEWFEKGKTSVLPDAQAYVGRMHTVAEVVGKRLAHLAGVQVEDKGASLSFHYRSAADPQAALTAIESAIAQVPESRGLVHRHGKMVLELRAPVDADKGTALERVVRERGLASVLAFGDDTTDVDSFRVVHRLRAAEGIPGVCVAIAAANTPDELLELADYRLDDPDAVELFLTWLAAETVEWPRL